MHLGFQSDAFVMLQFAHSNIDRGTSYNYSLYLQNSLLLASNVNYTNRI